MEREFRTNHIDGKWEILNPEIYFDMLAKSEGKGKWVTLPIVSKVERIHILYDPAVVPDYHIVRGQSHDGLIWFTYELIFNALLDLVYRRTWYKPKYDEIRHKESGYIIGDIRLATVYRLNGVDLPCGRYPGMRERLRIPVKYIVYG